MNAVISKAKSRRALSFQRRAGSAGIPLSIIVNDDLKMLNKFGFLRCHMPLGWATNWQACWDKVSGDGFVKRRPACRLVPNRELIDEMRVARPQAAPSFRSRYQS